MLRIIFFLFSLLFFHITSAQVILIKGKVVDKQSGIPLSSVSITVGSTGASSNINGYYSFAVEKKIAEQNKIILTHIGYQVVSLNINSLNYHLVEMEISKNNMPEVIVGSGVERIIRKAIERIPLNYPSNDFILDGIMRIYHTETDTPKCYRFFKSDAVVKVHYPAYTDSETDAEVSVIQNKTVYLKPNQAPYDSSIWIGSYLIDDFVHKRADFISKEEIDNFKYHIYL